MGRTVVCRPKDGQVETSYIDFMYSLSKKCLRGEKKSNKIPTLLIVNP